MAINEVPVALEEILFVNAAEDFQKDEDGEYRTDRAGEFYQLDVEVLGAVEDFGQPVLRDQRISLEVPVDKAPEELKRIRSTPRLQEVKFDSLKMRAGVSKRTGNFYAMWTGKGLQPVKSTPSAPAAAQRQG